MRLFLAACAVLIAGSVAGKAKTPAEFYAGKTVQIINPFGVGGAYGVSGQLFAKHLSKHVPGNPTVILQSMPGAGGVTAMKYATQIAPKDGSVLFMPIATITQQDLLDPKFGINAAELQWIGRLDAVRQLGVVWTKTGVRSVADAKRIQVVAGGVGVASATALNPRLLNELAGTKFKILPSYRDLAALMLAFERGEVDVLTANWDLLLERYKPKIDAGEIAAIYAFSHEPIEGAENVPVISSFAVSDDDKAFMQIYTLTAEIGRALAAAAGVPRDRVEAWRQAFSKMLADAEFKDAIAKAQIRISPMEGTKLQEMVSAAYQLPAPALERIRAFYARLVGPAQ